ncbi:hypothetical protein A462_24799 [Pseudomonas sp. Ag1]|uniref:hypothetical protein n=1 Tax=Pseudomonas sp. Ag1 TaxID=1197727 RepID=UPI000272CA45|nr:hypothetical protein [Pseudomonas sp. Ag1]EJF69137.1 hypothetical protein A462_24799 [Pseudomonas sp. Ag1]
MFGSINAILFVLGAMFGALSLAFFNYVEGVMKDVPKKLKAQNLELYLSVVKALTDLKGEVIGNVLLVVALLVVAFFAGAIGEMEFIQRLKFSSYWMWGVQSVRGACLLSVIVVVCVQLAGFITANSLRAEVSMYGE